MRKLKRPKPTAPKRAVHAEKIVSPLQGLKKSWITTNENVANKQIEQKAQANARNMVQRFWLRDGESKTIRFRYDTMLGSINQYVFPVGGKFTTFTAPGINPDTGRSDPDLFLQHGHTPTAKFLFEIIDRTGFTNRSGEEIKDVSRIWEVGTRLYQQICVVKENTDDFTGIDYIVQRSGTGTSTTYTLIAGKATPCNFAKIASVSDKVAEWYAPPTLEEQEAFLARLPAV